MAKQAPDPIDVQDFQFILHCRLKVFTNEDSTKFNKPCSLVATANRFGLIFIGTTSPAFQVIQLKTIEKHTVKEGEITNYNRRDISLPSPPKHLVVNCDCTKLAVVVERNDCAIGLIYDVTSMMKQVLPPPVEIRLSPTPGVDVIEASWNPTIPNIFTACKSDGTLGLYELKETGVDINELPAESQATCMCWSPKGKQIAVGSQNGRITQYKPDLKAMKVVNPPPLQGSPAVIALQWISNYQFIAVYKPQIPDSGASLLVVDAPKTGETTYSNYDDICYSYGNTRPPQFYTIFQAVWNVLMVASSNSMEVGVLGNIGEQWTLWILADSARAELPLSTSKQETLPVGLAFDASATEPVIWGESSLPPAPYLLLLSHHGLLCCFRVINIRSGVASICQPPEPLSDTSGLNQFISVVETVKDLPPKPELPKPVPALLPKIPEASLHQQPPSFSQPSISTAPKFPQVPLFTNPPSSLFGSGPQFSIQTSKSESAFLPKPDSAPKTLFGGSLQQPVPLSVPTPSLPARSILNVPSVVASTPSVVNTITPTVSLAAPTVQVPQSSDGQEDAEILISKLVREECDMLETELKALLHKGRSLKIDLGSDTEAVDLVHGTDILEEFLKEVNETSAGQAAEVHSLKQGLIQTWAWYEDARSRFAQTQDLALEALLRIQQLDPVSQRYLADIQHMTYYLNSQLTQANRVLDEQWENFQDSCRKIVKLKIPTMETIYQTMVRQSAVHQRQQYILKDISSRIRAQRSKMTNPTLLISLNNADQLEKELRRLQLEPQHFLQAQYERVLQNQQQLTSNKVQKLSKLLLDREIVRVTYNKPKIVTPFAKAATIYSSPQNKSAIEPSLIGAGLSPIGTGKQAEPRVVDFIQSTPKSVPSLTDQKQNFAPLVTSSVDAFKTPNIPLKFTSSAQSGTTAPTLLGQLPTSTAAAATKVDPVQFKFTTIPPTTGSSTTQLNFGFDLVSSTSKIASPPVSFTATPVSQTKPATEVIQSKPSASFGSLFGLNKSASSTFSFSLTTTTVVTTTTATTANAKPIASSTTSSAFVPTTQLPFSFSAKVPISTSAPNLVSTSGTTVPKSSTFIFGTATSGGNKADNSNTVSSPASNTVAITVVSSSAPATTSSLFGLLKTPTVDSSAATTTTTVSSITLTPLFKTSAAETTGTASIFQGFLPPKTSISIIPAESAVVPSSETVVPASSTDKTTPIVVSSSQGSLFGTVTTTTSTFSFANIAKTAQAVTTTVATTPSTVSTPITKSEKDSSVFGKGSIFGAAVTVAASTGSSSLFGTAATTTTTTTSIFGTTGSIFGNPPVNVAVSSTTTTTSSIFANSATATTTLASIFNVPTTTGGSIFGASPATATSTGSIFGSAVASTTTPESTFGSTVTASTTTATTKGSIFGAIASQPTEPLTSNSTPIFSAVPTTTMSSTVFATTVTTPAPLNIPSTNVATPGFAATTTTITSIFGSVPATTTTSSSGSVFNIPATTSASIFAAANASIFGSPTSSVFTQPATQPTSAGSSVFGAATPTSPVFGGLPKTTASGPFGGAPTFGSGTTSAFGATTTTSSSVFGQPAAFGSGSVFGAPVSSSTNTFGSSFGSGGSLFGSPNTTSTTTFGQSQSSTFSFTAAAASVPSSNNSSFGFSKPSSTFGFGATPASTDSSSFSFGNLNVGAATTTANTSFGPAFGQQPSNSNPFAKATGQEQKPAFGGGSLFSTPTTTAASSIFGGGATTGFGSPAFGTPSSGFGSPSTFGQQPAFAQNQSTFGGTSSFGSPSQPGPFSGGNQSVAQTGFGGFGQAQKPSGFGAAPVFGGSPGGFGSSPSFGGGSSAFGGAPAFGTPPTAATSSFGAPAQQENPTFATFAAQNTLGFGALAQQSQTNPSMSFSGGGSSFSTWR